MLLPLSLYFRRAPAAAVPPPENFSGESQNDEEIDPSRIYPIPTTTRLHHPPMPPQPPSSRPYHLTVIIILTPPSPSPHKTGACGLLIKPSWCMGLRQHHRGAVGLWVNNQGACLAVETAGEGVGLAVDSRDEGATSERPSEPQPTPSPSHPSEANVEPPSDLSPRPSPTPHILDSIPESSDGNQGGHSSSDKSLSGNEGDMTLQSVYDLCISLCTQVSDQAKEIQRLKAQIKKLKKQSKPGRKSAKGEPSVHKDSLFDDIPKDTLDYMETEDAQDVGRSRDVVNEEKERMLMLNTDGSKVSTNKEKDSTERTNKGTDDQTEVRRATQTIQTTQTPTSTMFGDDETIAQVFLNISQAKAVCKRKEKELIPKIKGKKKIEEKGISLKLNMRYYLRAEKSLSKPCNEEERLESCKRIGKQNKKEKE
ncbi:hypothetical protein Tco_0135093 [Tanacetum coccineum]